MMMVMTTAVITVTNYTYLYLPFPVYSLIIGFFLDIYLTMSSQKMQFSISVNKYGSILVFLILHSFVQYKIEP